MTGRSAPKPSQTISSAARSGRIADQRRVQAAIRATRSPRTMDIDPDRRRDGGATACPYHRAVPGSGPARPGSAAATTARGAGGAMGGASGLHGGGEYQTGDEPFLDALIGVAR